MDDLWFVCKLDGHDEEDIIGFCLNQQCVHEAQICIKCCWDKHGEHQKDCKTFDQIQKLLQNNKQQSNLQNEEVIKKLKQISQISEKLCQLNCGGNQKLIELENNLKTQQYQNCLADKAFLKNLQNFTKNQTQLILEQLDNIMIALDSLGIPKVIKTYATKSQNTETINQIQKKNQEIQVNIETTTKSEQVENKQQNNQSSQNQEEEIQITYEKPKPKQEQQQSIFQPQNFQTSNNKIPLTQQPPKFNGQQNNPIQNLISQSSILQQTQTSTNAIPNVQQVQNLFKSMHSGSNSLQSLLSATNPQSLNQPINQSQQYQYPMNEKQIPVEQINFPDFKNIQKLTQMKGNDSSSDMDAKQQFEKFIKKQMINAPESSNLSSPEINLSPEQWDYYRMLFKKACPEKNDVFLNSQNNETQAESLKDILDACNQAIDADIQNYDAYVKKSQTLIKFKQYEDALESCEMAQDIFQSNTKQDIFVLRGIALNALGRYEQALNNYCIAIALQPTYDAYLYYGMSLLVLQDYDQAIVQFDQSIKMKPQQEEGYFQKGLALMNQSKYYQAVVSFDSVLSRQPKNGQVLIKKAQCLNELKKFEEAHKCADSAIEILPNEQSLYFIKGFALFHLQNQEEALKCFDKALELNNEIAEIHYYKGLTLHHLQRFQEAIASFDKAFILDPNPAYNTQKGDTLKAMEQYEQTKQVNEQANCVNQNSDINDLDQKLE